MHLCASDGMLRSVWRRGYTRWEQAGNFGVALTDINDTRARQFHLGAAFASLV